MKKKSETQQEKEMELTENQTPQNEIIEDEDFNDMSEDELEDEFDEFEIEEEETETKPSKAEPKEETLTPFATVIKTYLEEQAKTDTELAKTLDTSVHAYNLCNKWIEDYVKEGIKNKSGCQVGVLSDQDGYRMMKEFFTDGVYVMKMDEEKQRAEKAKKDAEERAVKEAKKKALEEEKKKKEEEEKRREEEYKKFMETGKSDLTPTELEMEKYKHLKQQDLFEF